MRKNLIAFGSIKVTSMLCKDFFQIFLPFYAYILEFKYYNVRRVFCVHVLKLGKITAALIWSYIYTDIKSISCKTASFLVRSHHRVHTLDVNDRIITLRSPGQENDKLYIRLYVEIFENAYSISLRYVHRIEIVRSNRYNMREWSCHYSLCCEFYKEKSYFLLF